MKKIEINDKNKMTLKEFVNARWNYYELDEGTLLHMAVFTENLELVKKALEFGAEIDMKYNGGGTALTLAYDLEIAKELINAGADPNILTNGNNIAVTYMYKHSNLPLKEYRKTLEYLISVSDIDLPGGHGYTLLLALIEKKEEDYDLFKLVIDNTKNLSKLCDDETLLFDAAQHIKNEKIFLLLAQSGIDLYQKNKKGLDFYHYCSENIQKMLREKMPEFIKKREENGLYIANLDLGRLF